MTSRVVIIAIALVSLSALANATKSHDQDLISAWEENKAQTEELVKSERTAAEDALKGTILKQLEQIHDQLSHGRDASDAFGQRSALDGKEVRSQRSFISNDHHVSTYRPQHHTIPSYEAVRPLQPPPGFSSSVYTSSSSRVSPSADISHDSKSQKTDRFTSSPSVSAHMKSGPLTPKISSSPISNKQATSKSGRILHSIANMFSRSKRTESKRSSQRLSRMMMTNDGDSAAANTHS